METIVIAVVIGKEWSFDSVELQDNWVEQCYELDNKYTQWRIL